jgi:hypothetical protein
MSGLRPISEDAEEPENPNDSGQIPPGQMRFDFGG